MAMIGERISPFPEPVVAPVTALLSDADVTERLLLEFEATHGLQLVSSVIRTCRSELRKSAPAYPAESLEALVRGRLTGGHAMPVEAGAA
ncbi:MAG TPA: hypothetical protein VIQ30_14240 [Pseudonocardia sp.]|jgi:hypothetical protein